nr:C-type lectin domain family 2 member B-like [Pelodiscus sinensis]|eukprot:XP_006110773.1 C-type lectin domain family 2 member B-like [Pelodiscus sinensis]
MDPARETLRTGIYPSIPGHPEGARPGNSHGCQLWKQVACTVALAVVLVGLIVAIAVLSVLVSKTPPRLMPWCPDGWLGYQGKCYYFSEAELSWNDSRMNCSAFGASLAGIDSKQQLMFMMRYNGDLEHWIGLWRGNQQWTWVNGSNFNSPSLLIRGGGDCAYLSAKSISSSRCTTERNWVCSQPDAHTVQQSVMLRSQELQHP